MKSEKGDIKERTFKFAITIVKIVFLLPRNTAGFALGRQLIKSGTSIGANVEEATGAYSKKEFTSCKNIAKREARETIYWLKLITDSKLLDGSKTKEAIKECGEILRMLTAIVKSSQKNL